MNSLTQKKCKDCGEWKDRSEFYKNSSHKDGLNNSCKECKDGMTRKWRSENKEKINAQDTARANRWRKNNRDKELERHRRYYASHSKIKNIAGLVRRAKKTFKDAAEKARVWAAENRDKRRESDRNRRARKKNCTGTVTKQEWQLVLDKYGHKCLYPGCDRTDIEMDHVIPLALGGTHTADNVQPLCAYHNRVKHTKIIDYR